MSKLIRPIKGTRDFYPEEMSIRKWLYNQMREAAESYGYSEYEGPLLEPVELYAAKSGEELVKEQSFVFPDRGGDLITLRPELTPTLARMVAQKQGQLHFPLKWWSFGPFWRYERPQRGRTREFFQWNVDLIGKGSSFGDAEIAAIMVAFFRRVGLTPSHLKIHVNNRRLIDSSLDALKISAEQKPFIFKLIDRKEKMTFESWQEYSKELGIPESIFAKLVSLLDNPSLWQESDELVQFFDAAKSLGITEYLEYSPQVVRGLDYYTGNVFEAKSLSKTFRRAILGGGRYDNLLEDVGGKPLPGVGFAMGDVIIALLLQHHNLIPKDSITTKSEILVTVFDETHIYQSLNLAQELRDKGIIVSTYPTPDKLGKQFKYADRYNIEIVVVLGPDEIENQIVTIKRMSDGTQMKIPREEISQTLMGMLVDKFPS